MKRKEVLESVNQKDAKFDIEEIIENDKDFFSDRIEEATKRIRDANKSIRAYLKNPDAALDSQFLTLAKEVEKDEAELAFLKATKEEYL